MRKKGKQVIAALLTAVLLGTAAQGTGYAAGNQYETGTAESFYKGNYYDKDGQTVRDAFIKIGDRHYYFDADGNLLKPERDGNQEVGFELMEIQDELYFVEFTGNIWQPNGWMLAKDGRFADDNGSYWFFRDNKGKIAMADEGEDFLVKKVNQKPYAFDENGHMVVKQKIETKDGTYYPMNQSDGSFALNRWLLIDGEWYFFNDEYMMTSPKEPCPYYAVDEVELQYKGELEVEVGTSVELPISFTVATDNNAEKSVGTVSSSRSGSKEKNGEQDHVYTGTKAARALRNAYDYGYYVQDVSGEETGVNTTKNLKFDSNRAAIIYNSNIPATVEISFEIDDIRSAPIRLTFVRTEDVTQGDTEKNVGQLLDEQPKAVVDGLKALNQTNLTNMLKENKNNIVSRLAKVELDYQTEYNIGMKQEIKPEVEKSFDSRKVQIVGAVMNGAPDDDVVFQVDQSTEEIDDTAITKTERYPVDLSLLINGTPVSQLSIPTVITMPIPGTIEPSSLEIYHYHNGEQKKLDISVNQSKRTASFTTDSFSTFLFVGDVRTTGSGGSSSGGGRVTPANPLEISGSWMQDETGWWFKKYDGSYPVSTWALQAGSWYRFDERGYMITGWFTDGDGNRYYLNPVSDGSKGVMKTGWQLIDGQWYYLNATSTGVQGVLLTNTTTPDGYVVDGNGVWIP